VSAAVVDAVVVGSGPNGLVAANVLADAGWEVVVLEAQPDPGGAVRSGDITVPGFHHDRFSAFYPLAAVSPVIAALELESHGLVWRRAPIAVAHVFPDGRSAAISPDVDATAASVDRFAVGDGDAWRGLVEQWDLLGGPLVDALLKPFPPVGSTLRLLRRLGRPREVMGFARFALLPVRRFAAERFRGDGAAMLLAGNTLHTDLTPDSTLGGFYGWLLAMLAQTVGFPVPEGGSGALTGALVRRFERQGGQLRCGAEVTEIVIRSGTAVGVRLVTGEEISARRGVIADVVAPRLFRDLVGERHLPAAFMEDLGRFELDHGTFKVDWALREPIPWRDPDARRAATLHLGDTMDHLARFAADLAAGRLPERPFILFGQMGRADPTRSPVGTETAWAYTHVPNTASRPDAVSWDEETTARVVARIESEVEQRAPGFRDLILGRHVMSPLALEAANANLLGGAVNGGTTQLHQQLIFRPTLGRAGAATPIRRLFLGSASAHPGGGVHGACGANAATALLRSARLRKLTGVSSLRR
jgi:phytoene dehydrogenase-like protein